MWGQSTQFISSLSPKRDCSPTGVEASQRKLASVGRVTPGVLNTGRYYQNILRKKVQAFRMSVQQYDHQPCCLAPHLLYFIECVCRTGRIQYDDMTLHPLTAVLTAYRYVATQYLRGVALWPHNLYLSWDWRIRTGYWLIWMSTGRKNGLMWRKHTHTFPLKRGGESAERRAARLVWNDLDEVSARSRLFCCARPRPSLPGR